MKQFLFRQKVRFDIGMTLFAFVNFALVVVAAGDKLSSFFHVNTRTLLVIIVPGAVFGVWLIGYVMDRLQYMQGYHKEMNDRNNNWDRLFRELEEIRKK